MVSGVPIRVYICWLPQINHQVLLSVRGGLDPRIFPQLHLHFETSEAERASNAGDVLFVLRCTWTPKVCKLMALWAVCLEALGHDFTYLGDAGMVMYVISVRAQPPGMLLAHAFDSSKSVSSESRFGLPRTCALSAAWLSVLSSAGSRNPARATHAKHGRSD